jgi:hypothetical protein
VKTPIGSVDYDLTGIVLKGFTLGSDSVTATGGNLQVHIAALSCSSTLKWHYREVLASANEKKID